MYVANNIYNMLWKFVTLKEKYNHKGFANGSKNVCNTKQVICYTSATLVVNTQKCKNVARYCTCISPGYLKTS